MWLNLFDKPLISGLVVMLTVALITDLSVRKISNNLVLIGLITSFLGQCLVLDGYGGLNWLAGVMVGFAFFIPLYWLRGMAAGDVKLMMAVGGFVGYPHIIKTAACVFIVGGVMALIMILVNGKFKLLLTNVRMMFTDFYIKASSGVSVADDYVMKNSAARMPYALAIAVGTAIALYL